MRRSHRARPAALLGTAALFAATCGAFVVVAPAASAATSPWSGHAAADLVHVNAVNIPGAVDVADATVAPATSVANTASTPRVTSDATNANLQLLSAAINQNLVVEAKQTALPDHPAGVHDELLSIPAAPVLTASITTADAHSRWKADDSCFTGGPISLATSKVADAVVLPGVAGVGDGVALDNDADPSGAAVAQTILGLAKQPAN